MRFTAPEEYGLRCMLQMVRQAPDKSVTINELAAMESLTPAYIAKLMRILRKAKLVESTRGQKGGYLLARPADEINVSEVLKALGGDLHSEEYCTRYSGTARRCVHSRDCNVKDLWTSVDQLISSVLSKCKLTDLVQDKSHIQQWLENNLDMENASLNLSSDCGSS